MAEVQLEKVSKIYPNGLPAVSNLDLDVAEGEFMVLVGPSGCGKTTALRMVAGLEDITSGTLRIGGRVVNDLAPKDRDVAMVFQNYALYPHMTVAENIGFALKLRKVPKDELNRKVKDAARAARPDRLARTQAGPAVRWPAPAGRDGPGHRARTVGVLDGRAAVQPRRQAARPDARRDLPHPAPGRRGDVLRHPRPDRGDDDGRPGGRAAQGRAPAVRHPQGALRTPGQPLRRRLHRLAGDEPVRGHPFARRYRAQARFAVT